MPGRSAQNPLAQTAGDHSRHLVASAQDSAAIQGLSGLTAMVNPPERLCIGLLGARQARHSCCGCRCDGHEAGISSIVGAAQVLREIAMTRKLISSGSPFEEQIGYSRAVVDGEWIFVSGTTGFDYATMTISADVTEQADQCLQNIRNALRRAGADLTDVVRVTYILPKAEDFEPCWPVLRRHFGEVRPAATMICAGLLDPRMKIEIEVTARRYRTP
jgi:enamine deaminase RidA (YjgF/YER057c/UK114 family)